MMLGWREEEESLERRESRGMQSKALEKSMATAVVLAGGLELLKPSAIAVERGSSAEVVECEDLKPCWVEWVGRDCLRKGRIRRSRTLAAGDRREIGR